MTDLNRVWSPPKAGRTWLRVAFGKLYCIQNNKPDNDVFNLSRRVAGFSHRIRAIRPEHHSIFLIRDPKDLFVSEYFAHLYRNRLQPSISISDYLRLDWDPIGRCIKTYRQYERCTKRYENTKTVRYECLIKDFRSELTQILTFFNVEYTPSELTETIQWCAFNNLRELSGKSYFKTAYLNPGDPENPESCNF